MGAKTIGGVKQGGFDTSNRFMNAFTLEYSDDDSSWSSLGSKSGLSYPGNNTLSSEYTFTTAGAHRYWRIKSVTVGGSLLEVSEIQLFESGVNVNSSATKTTSHSPPGLGSGQPFSNLFDGNLTTRTWWDSGTLAGDFWIKWDFGADAVAAPKMIFYKRLRAA